MGNKKFVIKSYTLKQLAEKYHCTPKIFRPWVKRIEDKIGPRVGHFFSPRQVQIMVDHFGAPFYWLLGLYVKLMMGDDDDHDDQNHQGHDNHGNQEGRMRYIGRQ